MSKALYRKYRSKSLDEIVGQKHVTDILARSLEAGRVAHAYLLTGPKGVGKTSIARILAYEINKLPYDEDATNLDIIEIDAASNNGVEDVRELREKVQVAPVSASKKIYIIDEVHMLSKAAFNALLKTLEEPPEHAVFILATTDADKLPATIISRTQQFSFRAITPEDAIKHMRHIATQEKIAIDDGALELVAMRGDGSFRDSISLLDQLRSLTDEKTGITRELVEQSLGLASGEHVEKLLGAYEARDLRKIIELCDESDRSGVQPNVLVQQLIQTVRRNIAEKPQLLPLLDQLLDVVKSSQPSIKLLTVLASHAAPKPKNAALSAPSLEVSAPIKELERQASRPLDDSSSLPPSAPSQGHSTGVAGDSPWRSARPGGDILSDERTEEARQTQSVAVSASSRSLGITGKHLQPEPQATPGPELRPGAKSFAGDIERKGEQNGARNEAVSGDFGDVAEGGQKENSTGDLDSDQTDTKKVSTASESHLENLDWEKLVEYTRQNFVAIYSVLSKCSYEIDGEKLVIYTINPFYKKKLDDSKYRIKLLDALVETGVGNVEVETIGTPPPPKDSAAAAVAAIMGGGEEVVVDA